MLFDNTVIGRVEREGASVREERVLVGDDIDVVVLELCHGDFDRHAGRVERGGGMGAGGWRRAVGGKNGTTNILKLARLSEIVRKMTARRVSKVVQWIGLRWTGRSVNRTARAGGGGEQYNREERSSNRNSDDADWACCRPLAHIGTLLRRLGSVWIDTRLEKRRNGPRSK